MSSVTERLREEIHVKTFIDVLSSAEKGVKREAARPGVELCLERARLITESYKATESEHMETRRAKALAYLMDNKTIYILPWERIVGNVSSKPSNMSLYPELQFRWVDKAVDGVYKGLLTDQEREEVHQIWRYWQGKTLNSKGIDAIPDELKPYWRYDKTGCYSMFWGGGTGTPNYEKVFRVGLNGIIKEVEDKFHSRVAAAEYDFKKKLSEKADTAKQARSGLGTQVREHEVKLQSARRAKASMNNLRKWSQMSETDKIALVYGDEVLPMKEAELARQLEGHMPLREAVVEPTTVPVPKIVEPGTAGAMKIGERPLHRMYDINFDEQRNLARFAYDGSNMPDDLRGRQFLGKTNAASDKIYSAQTVISNSNDLAIRGFGYHLFEAPQGGTAAKITVAARVRNFQNQIRSAMRNRTNEGLEEWGAEQGIGRVALLMKKENFSAYNKMVMQEVKKPGTYNSPAVIKGAEGVRDQLNLGGKTWKDAGGAGSGEGVGSSVGVGAGTLGVSTGFAHDLMRMRESTAITTRATNLTAFTFSSTFH